MLKSSFLLDTYFRVFFYFFFIAGVLVGMIGVVDLVATVLYVLCFYIENKQNRVEKIV
jgi:hypothetical protein